MPLLSAILGLDHSKVSVEAGGPSLPPTHTHTLQTHTFDFEVHVAAGTEMCDDTMCEARMDPCRWR